MVSERNHLKQTEIGEIPTEWEVVPLGDVISELKAGVSVNSENRNKSDGEFGILKTSAVTYGIFQSNEHKTILPDEVSRATETPLQDHIIVSRMNTPALVGASAYVDRDYPDLFLPDRLWQVYVHSCELTSCKWLSFVLRWDKMRSRISEIATGTSGSMKNISKSAFVSLKVAIPPIHEQKKIAAILTSIDDAIVATQRIIDQTEVVKRGLMKQLLTKGIGHTKFKQTEIGEIPTAWQVLTLAEMLEKGMILGHQDGNHGELYPRSEEFTNQGVPYLSANCITNGHVDLSLAKFLPMERASKFKKGVAKNQDVLFAHNATVGPVSVLKTDLDFVVLSTTLTYYRCNAELINPYYLSQYMTSPMFVGQYTRVMGQTTRNQVPLTLQRKFFHVIPPIDEQMQITEILSSTDKKLHGEKSKLSILLRLKQGLMQVLLTGKVRVNVDELSEVSV